jgi:unsaturated chondroitin disaccharide hydrolase
MFRNRLLCLVFLSAIFILAGCSSPFDVNKNLDYCRDQAAKTAATIKTYDSLPRTIDKGDTRWKMISYRDWTSGFWPGTLWYVYEHTRDEQWKTKAIGFTQTLAPLASEKAHDHDLGFQIFCSYGNALRLTGDTSYKKIILAAADTLATLFNPKTGTILSWPGNVAKYGGHNTIIDNMMNLELLFWAAKNGGPAKLYDIAVQHANTTMANHFRPDHTSYHVIVYDTVSGKAIKKLTHQGYSDSSMWARGQAWGIYGYTMVFRETKKPEYLDFAQKLADVYLKALPHDLVPYWDFNAPDIPQAPKDASAAAICASALIELSGYTADKAKGDAYLQKAKDILASLSTDKYQSRNVNDAFLLHCTGHKPKGSEIDASINYADYYYIEALTRLKKQSEGKSILQ